MYVLGEQIGSGSFGTVVAVTCEKTGEHLAMKIESCKREKRKSFVKTECAVYSSLGSAPGFPKLHWHDDTRIVMDRMRRSISGIHRPHHVARVGIEALTCLESLHASGWLHRDIKPDNLMLDDKYRVKLLDFGLAKRYMNSSGRHRPYSQKRSLTGTPRYASINNHLGIEQSRRDDLESLGYVLVYMMRGSLPWQNILHGKKFASKTERNRRIMEYKMTTPLDTLCATVPTPFREFIVMCRALSYEECPNYEAYRELLQDVHGYSRPLPEEDEHK